MLASLAALAIVDACMHVNVSTAGLTTEHALARCGPCMNLPRCSRPFKAVLRGLRREPYH